jgi:adenosine kinase
MNRALVIGSIAYDRIFTIDGAVEDGIIIEENMIKNLDLTFRADEPVIQFGGTGGNIAYGLGQFGASAVLTGVVGNDFHFDYKSRLQDLGIETNVYTKENSITATFYGIEDRNHKTISIWQPNASTYMEELSLKDTIIKEFLNDISVGIVSAPGKPSGIPQFLAEARELLGKDIPLIFDPGQDLSFMSRDQIMQSLESANIVIVNEVEINQLKKQAQLEIENIFGLGIEMVIVTKGAEGVTAYLSDGSEVSVAACEISEIVQVTGAGDAFRAGFINGILNNYKLEESLKYGSVMGSFAVEAMGGQGYEVNEFEIEKRFKENY